MRAACEKCGHAEHWYVRRVSEHWDTLLMPLGHGQGVSFAIVVCVGCGHTSWYGSALKGAPVSDLSDEGDGCAGCAGRLHRTLDPVLEQASPTGRVPLPISFVDGNTEGQLACDICADCGRVDWFARETGWLSKTGQVVPRGDATCPRCPHRGGWWVRPVRETGGETMIVAPQPDGVERGRFELRFCAGCGFAEWFAVGIGGLQADGVNVIRLTGAPKQQQAPAGGPYR